MCFGQFFLPASGEIKYRCMQEAGSANTAQSHNTPLWMFAPKALALMGRVTICASELARRDPVRLLIGPLMPDNLDAFSLESLCL